MVPVVICWRCSMYNTCVCLGYPTTGLKLAPIWHRHCPASKFPAMSHTSGESALGVVFRFVVSFRDIRPHLTPIACLQGAEKDPLSHSGSDIGRAAAGWFWGGKEGREG